MTIILINQSVLVNWSPSNRTWYESKGYQFTKYKEPFSVEIEHLAKNSRYKVNILCDFCEIVFERVYRDYLKIKKKSSSPNDSCRGCSHKKRVENNLHVYGVEHATQTKETKEKRRQTSLKEYGVEHYIVSDICREKRKQTCIKKFGVENPFQNKDIISQINRTNIIRHGYSFVMQDPNRKHAIMAKRADTMYKNGIAPCSKQQRFIHNIIGGELNFPIGSLMLDIAFLDQKIYIEYQGSGHDLEVKMNKMTSEDFLKRERSRYYFLKNRGWKQVEIISRFDKLPTPEKICEIIETSISHFADGHSWVKFDIDEKRFVSSIHNENYDFGDIRKIKKAS